MNGRDPAALVGPAVADASLRTPGLGSSTLERPELVQRLDRDVWTRRLTLIIGSAGWGKTTLLAQWLGSTTRSARVACVDLDAADEDPVRFWSSAVTALAGTDAAFEPLRRHLDPLTVVADQWTPVMVAAADRAVDDVALVLDGYQHIRSTTVHDAIARLLQHGPERLHLVIASRSEPPLPVARLRANDQVNELGPSELRISDDEAGPLLARVSGRNLSEEQTRVLVDSIEGWPAGLHLTALSLRAREDLDDFVDSFGGDDRFILDYLTDEVLDAQPAEVRRFLVETSVLDRLSADLAEAVTDIAAAPELLRHVEREQLFLLPLDHRRVWFRYHPLFRDALRRTLDLDRERRVLLERRAAAWFIEHEQSGRAIDHLLAAGDRHEAADLVASAHWPLISAGQTSTVLGWLDRLPGRLVRNDARLLLARASACLFSGRSSEVAMALNLAAQAPPLEGPLPEGLPSVEAGIAMGRASLSTLLADVRAAKSWAARARELHGREHVAQRANCEALLASAAFRDGELDIAARLMHRAADLARSSDNVVARVGVVAGLARLHAARGELALAVERRDEAAALLESAATSSALARRLVLLASADTSLRTGSLAAARRAYVEVVEMSTLAHDRGNAIEATLGLAETEWRLGARDEAERRVVEARALVEASRGPGARTVTELDRVARLIGAHAPPRLPALTARQEDVLRAVREGLSDTDVAERLHISERTVHAHLREIYARLAVHSRRAAVEAFEELHAARTEAQMVRSTVSQLKILPLASRRSARRRARFGAP